MDIEKTLEAITQSLADSRAGQIAFEEESQKTWRRIDNTIAFLIEHQALFDENRRKADERFTQAEKRTDQAEKRMERADKRMDRLEAELVRTERVVAQSSRLITRLAVEGRRLRSDVRRTDAEGRKFRSEWRRSLAESNVRMTRIEKTLDALMNWQGRKNGRNGK